MRFAPDETCCLSDFSKVLKSQEQKGLDWSSLLLFVIISLCLEIGIQANFVVKM